MAAFFYEKEKSKKCLQKALEPKSAGELAIVWNSHVSTVYDLTFVLKLALVDHLLADGHYNLCNSNFANYNWHFLN